MADYSGRYFSSRDQLLLNSFNAELLGDIIQTIVLLYKIAPTETKTNVYGETNQTTGKFYYPAVEMTALIERTDISSEDEGFGPDRKQSVVFKFRELMLKEVNFFPNLGIWSFLTNVIMKLIMLFKNNLMVASLKKVVR